MLSKLFCYQNYFAISKITTCCSTYRTSPETQATLKLSLNPGYNNNNNPGFNQITRHQVATSHDLHAPVWNRLFTIFHHYIDLFDTSFSLTSSTILKITFSQHFYSCSRDEWLQSRRTQPHHKIHLQLHNRKWPFKQLQS